MDLKKEYKKAFEFLRKSREFIYIAILVFAIFGVLGFLFPVPKVLSDLILNFISLLIEKTQSMSSGELIKFIFLNNLQSSFFSILLGVFLGIFPIISAAMNGYVLGFVAKLSVNEAGIFVLWRILPHGIFELPAIFISMGLGLKFGSFIFQKNKSKSFKDYLWNSIKVFILIILPLLIIAAMIEGSLIFFSK